MAKGVSGRLVIEIDPELKDELYTALNKEGLNLKQWFLLNTEQYLRNRSQMSLLLSEDKNSTRKAS